MKKYLPYAIAAGVLFALWWLFFRKPKTGGLTGTSNITTDAGALVAGTGGTPTPVEQAVIDANNAALGILPL